jgi:beta-mannanase
MALEGQENRIGIYVPGALESGPRQAKAFESSTGRKVAILSFYEAWGNGNGPDIEGIESCLKQGFTPMITWEPWQLKAPEASGRPEDQKEYSLAALASGRYDGYMRKWALDLKRISSPVFLRPMHEMNGNWYPWCGKVNGNTPQGYVAAWRHVRSIFRDTGSDGTVSWVWSPYAESVLDEPGDGLDRYFPGVENVDWLALDGYNWGSTRKWSRWRTFEEIFGKAYQRLSSLAAGKPLMIAETGCAEEGGGKNLWIQEAANALRNRFASVKALVWFDVNKECDWRIESSQQSLSAFRTHFNTW